MGLNNMVVLKVSFMLLLLLVVTIAGMDLIYHGAGYDPSSSESRETTAGCCDRCICTKSMPPQCQCRDARLNSCHSGCQKCACTYSLPAMCTCHDITDFCYPPCKDIDQDEDH